jgi:ABC-2 type transport system permease protein
MTNLIRAEALRLATTRTYWLLAAGATVVIAGGIAATAAATSFTPGTSPAASTLAIAGLAQTVALIAGALSVTGEFRHKTITLAVLITPRRTPLLAAKLIILAAAGMAFGLLVTGMAAVITLPLLAARHIPADLSPAGPTPASPSPASIAAVVIGGGIATALAAALGVGIGAIIRNQVGAIVTVLALLYVAEPLLGFIPHVSTAIQRYGLDGLASATTRTASFPSGVHLLGQAPAALVLAGYAAAALLAGAALLRGRDITA